MNIFKMTGYGHWLASGYVLEPLFSKSGGGYKPVLGLSYEISKEEKSLTIEFRKGVRFHNGEELTNKNLEFSFNCYMNEEYGADLWRPMFNIVEKIQLIGSHKAKIYFSKFQFNEVEHFLLRLRMLPIKFYALKNKKKWQNKLVGTGPYKFVSFKPNDSLKLKVNDNWWRSKRGLVFENLLLKSVKDADLAYQMILSKNIDLYRISEINNFFKIKDKPSLKFIKNEEDGSYLIRLRFNLRKMMFSHPVRKAITQFINFDEINKKFFGGNLENSVDGFNPNLRLDPPGVATPYNPGEAAEILTKEGWIDSDKNGVREKKLSKSDNSQELKFKILAMSHTQERLATYLQEELKSLGVLAEVERVVFSSELYKTLREGNYEAYMVEGVLSNDHSASYMHSKSFYNFSGYNSPKIDLLTKKLDSTFDLEKRLKILRQILLQYRRDRPESRGLSYTGAVYLLSEEVDLKADEPLNPIHWRRSN